MRLSSDQALALAQRFAIIFQIEDAEAVLKIRWPICSHDACIF
jgi:hypothetical protein